MDLNFISPRHSARSRKLFTTFVVVVAISAVSAAAFAFAPSRQFAVVSEAVTPLPTPLWTIANKISEARELLKNVKLKVGSVDITYEEERIAQDSATGQTVITKKKLKEPEKEIALAVLDTSNGEISIITVVKHGAELRVPSGWNIDILERPNGIRWNVWNTAFRINAPQHHVVIANVYPEDEVKSEDEYHLYTPYSPDIHMPDLVTAGKEYLANLVKQAFTDLREADVPSASRQGQFVADIWAPHSDFFLHIPFLEQTDLTEFLIDPQTTVDRINVIVGANQSLAYGSTCNSSSACGLLQFTPRTYKEIARVYPKARLIKDFEDGAKDHLNVMKAAILLYDYNLQGFIKSSGEKVLKDPKLEEYLAASYNGSPTRAHKSIAASVVGGIKDWINALTSKKGGLASETKGYLIKLRWLQENN